MNNRGMINEKLGTSAVENSWTFIVDKYGNILYIIYYYIFDKSFKNPSFSEK